MPRFASGNNADPQRLERVLDAKQRLIGVDVDALNGQVEEKRKRQEEEKAREQQYAEALASHVGTMTLGQLDAAAQRKVWDRSVQDFRSTNQGKSTTREWDLNRPDAQRCDSPARLGDSDPRCGPASLQQFEGEDLTIGKRTAAQMEQSKAWWDEQLAIKAAQKAEEEREEQHTADNIRTLDHLQRSMMGREAAARAELNRQTAAANKELQELQALKKDTERRDEVLAKLAELQAAAANPWLNEDPQQAASSMSPTRVRKDHWKGMSQAQRDSILQQQLEQVEARKGAASAAAADEAAAAAAQRNIQKALMLQAQSVDTFKRKQAEAAAGVLREQMTAKAAKDADRNELYANKVTEDYFKQFGTSHR